MTYRRQELCISIYQVIRVACPAACLLHMSTSANTHTCPLMQKNFHALRSAMTHHPVAHRINLPVYLQLTLMSALRQSMPLLSYSPDGGSYISFSRLHTLNEHGYRPALNARHRAHHSTLEDDSWYQYCMLAARHCRRRTSCIRSAFEEIVFCDRGLSRLPGFGESNAARPCGYLVLTLATAGVLRSRYIDVLRSASM